MSSRPSERLCLIYHRFDYDSKILLPAGSKRRGADFKCLRSPIFQEDDFEKSG